MGFYRGNKQVWMRSDNDVKEFLSILKEKPECDMVQLFSLQLICHGKTSRSHPHHSFPAGWYVTHSPKHWSNQETIQEIIVPYIEKVREDIGDNKRALMINNFKS